MDMTVLNSTVVVSMTKNPQTMGISMDDMVKGKSSSNPTFGK
jgi:hypothetical protein